MPNGTLGILLIGFHQEGIDLQVLETSQGGSHPQKEPVLAMLLFATFDGQKVGLAVLLVLSRGS